MWLVSDFFYLLHQLATLPVHHRHPSDSVACRRRKNYPGIARAQVMVVHGMVRSPAAFVGMDDDFGCRQRPFVGGGEGHDCVSKRGHVAVHPFPRRPSSNQNQQ